MLRMLQVHGFKVPTDDTVADHLGCPALLGHLISIEGFGDAGTAVCPMVALEAGMQALMAMATITVAITRHLVHDAGGLGCSPVAFYLGGGCVTLFAELFFRQDCRKGLSLGRRLVMEGWNIVLAQLGLSHGCQKDYNYGTDHAFHNERYFTSERLILETVSKVNFGKDLAAPKYNHARERCSNRCLKTSQERLLLLPQRLRCRNAPGAFYTPGFATCFFRLWFPSSSSFSSTSR